MKLTSYSKNENIKIGVLVENKIYDLQSIDDKIAGNMIDFIKGGEQQLTLARNAVKNNILSDKIIYESLISFKRAGANAIITYFADEIADKLNK